MNAYIVQRRVGGGDAGSQRLGRQRPVPSRRRSWPALSRARRRWAAGRLPCRSATAMARTGSPCWRNALRTARNGCARSAARPRRRGSGPSGARASGSRCMRLTRGRSVKTAIKFQPVPWRRGLCFFWLTTLFNDNRETQADPRDRPICWTWRAG